MNAFRKDASTTLKMLTEKNLPVVWHQEEFETICTTTLNISPTGI